MALTIQLMPGLLFLGATAIVAPRAKEALFDRRSLVTFPKWKFGQSLNDLASSTELLSICVYCSMFMSMLRIVRAELQVVIAVVVSNVVDVMNVLGRHQVPTEPFLHHENVLEDVSLSRTLAPVRVRMIRHKHVDVPVTPFVTAFEIPRSRALNEAPRGWIDRIWHGGQANMRGLRGQSLCAGAS